MAPRKKKEEAVAAPVAMAHAPVTEPFDPPKKAKRRPGYALSDEAKQEPLTETEAANRRAQLDALENNEVGWLYSRLHKEPVPSSMSRGQAIVTIVGHPKARHLLMRYLDGPTAAEVVSGIRRAGASI